MCSLEEAHGNENSLVNACPTAGHLDPEISQCSVVLEKKNGTVCSPEEAQGNEKALLNASSSGGHLDPKISRCSVVSEKINQSVCSPEEAQGNEKALVNACPNAGHLDPEISRCSVVLEKKIKGEVHDKFNDGKSTVRVHIQYMDRPKKEQEQSCRRKQMVKQSSNLIMKMSYIKRRYCHESHFLEGPVKEY